MQREITFFRSSHIKSRAAAGACCRRRASIPSRGGGCLSRNGMGWVWRQGGLLDGALWLGLGLSFLFVGACWWCVWLHRVFCAGGRDICLVVRHVIFGVSCVWRYYQGGAVPSFMKALKEVISLGWDCVVAGSLLPFDELP